MPKKNTEDAMIRVSFETRSRLKIRAAEMGVTLKEYLKRVANRAPYEKVK